MRSAQDGSTITCALFNPRGNVPKGYIAVGWLLFLQEQIKVIIITEAAKMEREVLAVRKRVLGGEHTDTVAAAGILALSLSRQGKYAEAKTKNPSLPPPREVEGWTPTPPPLPLRSSSLPRSLPLPWRYICVFVCVRVCASACVCMRARRRRWSARCLHCRSGCTEPSIPTRTPDSSINQRFLIVFPM